jgi:hypothetical protein
MLGWARYGFEKKCTRTHDAKLVVLHPVGSKCHIVHSAASGALNIDVIFFMLGWARSIFHKKHDRTRYTELVFLHVVGCMCRSHSAFRCVRV